MTISTEMTRFVFDNSYARLPERFFAVVPPTPVAEPALLRFNQELALELGIDPGPDAARIFAGNLLPIGAEPIAMAYAGHQFGQFVPQLGDGRAILLGEVIDRNGRRRDIQLKGSGITPFSRRGDGRAALGPMLREYIIGEAMTGLGIPSSRALAVVTTGEPVFRETTLPGAVLTRVAASHLRVGTFQFFAARRDVEAVKLLADYCIKRHYPDADSYPAFFAQVVRAQADLLAKWLLVGFIHGVMNTDNMSISGETFDYGPCAFMDAYHPDRVFSSIDQHGRYAYAQQPRIAQWNLARLAECLLPLFAEEDAKAVAIAEESLDVFAGAFETAFTDGLRRKIGLATAKDGDLALTQELLNLMAAYQADFTLTFRRLAEGREAELAGFEEWLARWRQRRESEEESRAIMLRANPAMIARNHLVEEALASAAQGDLAPFDALIAALADPFAARDDRYTEPPPAGGEPYVTFCGT
jgi:uncharacterized protein YdiU (UPF0061 family)